MEYLDEELLEAKRKLEYQAHTTLETGIYAGEELITFTKKFLKDLKVWLPLPDQFVIMPDSVKMVKYPSREAPSLIFTSLDSTVNISFNALPVLVESEDIKAMSIQFQDALRNINPSFSIKNHTDSKTEHGNNMTWFEYKGYHLDGESYNRIYLIQLKKTVLHCTFSCNIKEKNNWSIIIDKIFYKLEEEI